MSAEIAEKSARTSFSNNLLSPLVPNTQMPTFSNLVPPPPPLLNHTPMLSCSLDIVNYVPPKSSTVVQVHGGGSSSNPQRSVITTPFTELEKDSIKGIVFSAMVEFTKMACDGAPLWIPRIHADILNYQEYVRAFPVGLGPTP